MCKDSTQLILYCPNSFIVKLGLIPRSSAASSDLTPQDLKNLDGARKFLTKEIFCAENSNFKEFSCSQELCS